MMGMTIGALLFAYAGMVGLCQGLERHYKQVWGRTCPQLLRRVLRGAGWAGLLVSLLLCGGVWGWAMGPVAWFGGISLAAVLLVLLLPYWPRSAVAVAGLLPVWGLAQVFV